MRLYSFINTIITFLIVSFAIFIVVKMYNKVQDRLKKEEEVAKPQAPPQQEVLLTEIRDLLKK